MFFAFLLIIIGLVFLLKNLGLMTISWGIIWPLLLIGLGVYWGISIRRISEWWRKRHGKTLEKSD